MKKIFYVILVLSFSGLLANFALAQISVSVDYPANTTPNLLASYSSLASAITALNGVTAMSGPIVLSLSANGTETAPAGGYLLGSTSLNSSTSAVKTITFTKSGAGSNPIITAFAGTGTTDGIWKIQGTDYVTIENINLQENTGNTTSTTQMEWGYALVKKNSSSPYDGCQNVTIQNCSVSLNKSNTSSTGIYAGNHTSDVTADLSLSNASEALNNCRFYNNTISNVYFGIVLKGFSAASPYSLYDQNNEIGNTEGTGNTISGFGGGSVSCNGVYAIYQNNIKVNYNSVNGGTGTTGNLYGIYLSTGNASNVTINSNSVSVQGSGSSAEINAIRNSMGASGTVNTVNISNNTIENINYNTATSGSLCCIYNSANSGTLSISSNNINSNSTKGSGIFYGIYNSAACNTVNVNGNSISGNIHSGSGSMVLISNNVNMVTKTCNIYSNTINGDSITGSGGYLYGVYAMNGTINIYSNNIFDLSIDAGNGNLGGYYNNNSGGTESFYNNTIYNLTHNGSGPIFGVTINNSSSSGTKNTYGNVIHSLHSAGYVVHGFTSVSGAPHNFYNNRIYNISSNTIGYDIYGASFRVTTLNMYNNFISDLRTPVNTIAESINGVAILGNTTANLFYNTIYLDATSTSTSTFGTSAVYKVQTAVCDFRNNLIINKSIPGPAGGVTAALRWSAAYNPSYYSANSNNNCFYAGTPSARKLIFYDGTNSDQTIESYKTRVSSRDANSFSENPPFVNVSTVPYNLHLNTSVSTLCESGGTPVATPNITSDFDGDSRNTSVPDVGADEFSGFTDYVWTGSVSTDWNNAGNWSPAKTPVFSSKATINSGTAYSPVISSEAYCKGFVLGSGASLGILNDATLNVYGDITNNGSVTCGNTSSVFLKGTVQQNIIGNSINFGSLTLDNTNGTVLGNDITINNMLTLTNGKLYTKNGSDLHTVFFSGTAAPFTEANETANNRISGRAVMNQRTLSQPSQLSFLGVVLESTSEPTDFTIERITEIPESIVTINSISGIACKWHVSTSTVPTLPRSVTYCWLQELDNGNNFNTTNAQIWVSTDGDNWLTSGTATLTNSNPRSLQTSTTAFSYWTVSDVNHPLPVNLSSFNSVVNGRDVKLTWVTESEFNNKGFEIQRKAETENNWTKEGYVESKRNSNGQANYSFEDRKLNIGKYNYRLKQFDVNGNINYHSLGTVVEIALPEKFDLSQNYPNPFNPVTKIDFDLPFDSRISIIIYDMTGREIKTLVNDSRPAGFYTEIFNAAGISSGMYFYRIIAKSDGKEFVMTKKMALVK